MIFPGGALINGDSTRTFSVPAYALRKLAHSWRFAAFDPETVKLLISLFVSLSAYFFQRTYVLTPHQDANQTGEINFDEFTRLSRYIEVRIHQVPPPHGVVVGVTC